MENLQILIPIVVGLFVLGLCGYFSKDYWKPAKALKHDIDKTIEKIKEIRSTASPADYKQYIKKIFDESRFTHAWKMFSDTLHDEKGVNNEGEQTLIRSRATASSEFFFSQTAIVDTPIKSEFFKHLAGILTGIGIIGTFGGLLVGLSQFDPSGDPSAVQKSLGLLLHGVRDAFIASGLAIAAAMIITFVEKQLLRACYASLEELTAVLDSLFEAGVGEEYLERLVNSAQESATQAKILKDSLVNDLKEMLTNITEENQRNQQELSRTLTHSYQESGQSIANSISQSIEASLKLPLESIAASVTKASNEQGTAVHSLLEDVLVTFTTKLESTFGGQIQQMLAGTVSSMNEMQSGIAKLISDMSHSSNASASAIENQMVGLIANMQTKQQEMNLAMTKMLTHIEQAVGKIGETGALASQQMGMQMEGLLQGITSQIGSLLSNVEQKRLAQDNAVTDSQAQLNDNMSRMLTHIEQAVVKIGDTGASASQQMGMQMEGLLQGITGQIGSLLNNVEQKRLAQDNAVTDSQAQLNDNMSRMLTHIEQAVGKIGETGASASQQMGAQMEGLLQGITGQMNRMLNSIESKRIEHESAIAAGQQLLHDKTRQFIESIERQIVSLMTETQKSIQNSRLQLEALNSVSTQSIVGMNAGADKMRSAADVFVTASNGLTNVTEVNTTLFKEVNQISGSLITSCSQLKNVLTDSQRVQDTVDKAIIILQDLVASTHYETDMHSQIIVDMKAMTSALAGVRAETKDYLDEVSHVLGKGFDDFSGSVERSLVKALGIFDNTLDQSVQHLASGVKDLGEVAEELAEMANRNKRH
jgi:uncharacterized protein YicC (UPF0701 family)